MYIMYIGDSPGLQSCIYLLVTGLLAWRKLLWDTKPASTHPLTTKLKSNTYFKAGDFENAIKDFTSAVPESIMSYGGKQKVRYVTI